MAITPSGTVFVAGDKGLGSGEYLQATEGTSWVAITDAHGDAIRATDVVMGYYLLAFRSGERNDTTVCYATFGEKLDLRKE